MARPLGPLSRSAASGRDEPDTTPRRLGIRTGERRVDDERDPLPVRTELRIGQRSKRQHLIDGLHLRSFFGARMTHTAKWLPPVSMADSPFCVPNFVVRFSANEWMLHPQGNIDKVET